MTQTTSTRTKHRPHRRRRVLLLFALFLVAFLGFELGRPDHGPADVTIEFLHFTTRQTARFRMINASPDPVTFVGHGPQTPFYEVSLHLPDGWVAMSSDRLGMSAGFHTVQPAETVHFEVPVINHRSEWKLAVLCDRGAPRLLRLPDWLGWLPYRVYNVVRRRPKESSYIWSGVVPPFESQIRNPISPSPKETRNPKPEPRAGPRGE